MGSGLVAEAGGEVSGGSRQVYGERVVVGGGVIAGAERDGDRGDRFVVVKDGRSDGVDVFVMFAVIGGVTGFADAVQLGREVSWVGERSRGVALQWPVEQALAPRRAVGEQRFARGAGVRGFERAEDRLWGRLAGSDVQDADNVLVAGDPEGGDLSGLGGQRGKPRRGGARERVVGDGLA